MAYIALYYWACPIFAYIFINFALSREKAEFEGGELYDVKL